MKSGNGKGEQKLKRIKITDNDYEVFKCLARTGYATNSQLIQLGIGKKRADQLVKAGYLKSEKEIINGKVSKAYKLDKVGRSFVERCVAEVYYKYKSTSIIRDLAVTDRYLALDKQSRDYWKTKGDIKKMFGEKITEKMSLPDALVMSHSIEIDNQIIEKPIEVIQIITNNYGKKEIESKLAFTTEVLGLSEQEINFQKTKY